jgi:hypothetical protein
MSGGKRVVWWFALASFLIAAPSDADDLDAAKQKAIGELNDGQPQLACATLNPFLTSNPDDLILRFLIGQCLSGTGHPRAAIEQYRFILAHDPGAVRARAELGTTELAVGDIDGAREDLGVALQSGPPPEVATKLANALEQAHAPLSWSGAVSAAMMYDSNVDLGPLKNVVTLFGSPVVLMGSPPRAQSDWAGLLTAELNVFHPIDAAWSLAANLAANDVNYTSVTQFDFDSFSSSVGPTFQTDRLSLSVHLGASLARLGDQLYSFSWGGEPQLTVRLADGLTFIEQASAQANQYYTTHATDGWSATSVSALQWNFDQTQAYLEPKVSYAHQDARNTIYTDDSVNAEIDFFEPLGGGFTLLAQPSFGYAAYRAVDPAFNTTRHDKTYAVAANLGFEPAFLHCQLALGITFTANHSNQSLYSYNRVQTTLQLKVPF